MMVVLSRNIMHLIKDDIKVVTTLKFFMLISILEFKGLLLLLFELYQINGG